MARNKKAMTDKELKENLRIMKDGTTKYFAKHATTLRKEKKVDKPFIKYPTGRKIKVKRRKGY